MKKIIILLTLLLAGCGVIENTSEQFVTIYKPKYAERFEIRGNKDTMVLIVKDPWQGARKTEKRYTISKPLKTVIATSTSHLAFLEALNCSSLVKGISGKDYIYSSSYKEAADIGYDRSMDFEKVLSLESDGMLVYEVAGENGTVFGKLESLGVNVIYIADYLESSPLGRAEWIVAFGALTGKFKESEDYFTKVEKAYHSLRREVQADTKKVILNSPYRDTWYFPQSESYPIQLVKDAGGIYVGSDYKGSNSIPVGMETAYKYLLKADIWLNPSIGTNSLEDIKKVDARLATINIPLYNCDKRRTPIGGTDYYETGVVRPDLILKDLINIFSGGSTDSLFFYRRIE